MSSHLPNSVVVIIGRPSMHARYGAECFFFAALTDCFAIAIMVYRIACMYRYRQNLSIYISIGFGMNLLAGTIVVSNLMDVVNSMCRPLKSHPCLLTLSSPHFLFSYTSSVYTGKLPHLERGIVVPDALLRACGLLPGGVRRRGLLARVKAN